MNRRAFLSTASAAMASSVFDVSLAAQPSASAPVFAPVRRNVGVFTARGGTMGWLIGDQAVLVIDSQFADTAKLFLDGLASRTPRRIDLLLNTHHHPDHTGGNKVLRPLVTKIVAHRNVPGLQRKQAAEMKTASAQAYADGTFSQSWKAAVGDETVSARYYGPGHTSGDAVYRFERANVVHMGDLMYHQRHPGADRAAGASLRNWIVSLERVVKDHDRDTVYIFGHAKEGAPVTGSGKDLLVVRDCLTSLLDVVQKGIKAGKSADEITADWNVPGFNHLSGEPDFQTAYDELTARG
jgi:glyoxylase-like metal-dependent hydrolase (beta-lactamase superfamily II)